MNRFTSDDLPAFLLAGVSAITVTTGARLLRGQNALLMLALGVGIAGATFVLDRLLVERLNAVRPRQSLLALLLCWLPLFLFATTLATVATFSWIAPEIARHDLEESRRAHWTAEGEKISQYLLGLTTALRRQAVATQSEIDAERRRAASARHEGTTYSGDALRALQRKLATAREVERRIPSLPRLPIDEPPADAARAQIDAVYRGIADVHASASLVLASPPMLPSYQPFSPPSSDLQSVVAEESRKMTWRAMSAWGAALWVELLPLLALWRGGRKIPLAARVRQWRSRTRDTFDAMRGRQEPDALSIVIEPLHVRGIVRVAAPAEYTLTDCAPLLEEAVESLTTVLGPYQVSRVSNARGDMLDEGLPLLPQLRGEPLVLSVEECRS